MMAQLINHKFESLLDTELPFLYAKVSVYQ
ncbi:hypothetical protein SAMN05518848_104549, partial [Paenibacillus sp. PDC88]